MGWGSGANLMLDIINITKRHLGDTLIRTIFYRDLIKAFEKQDCDTLGDCLEIDPAFDVAYDELHPIAGQDG